MCRKFVAVFCELFEGICHVLFAFYGDEVVFLHCGACSASLGKAFCYRIERTFESEWLVKLSVFDHFFFYSTLLKHLSQLNKSQKSVKPHIAVVSSIVFLQTNAGGDVHYFCVLSVVFSYCRCRCHGRGNNRGEIVYKRGLIFLYIHIGNRAVRGDETSSFEAVAKSCLLLCNQIDSETYFAHKRKAYLSYHCNKFAIVSHIVKFSCNARVAYCSHFLSRGKQLLYLFDVSLKLYCRIGTSRQAVAASYAPIVNYKRLGLLEWLLQDTLLRTHNNSHTYFLPKTIPCLT